MGSIHNELTGRSGFISRAIRNALQVENAEVGVERLSETLNPIMDLWSRPEWNLLRGERIWTASPSTAGIAGEQAVLGVRNPAGSNLIVVVEDVYVTGALVFELRAAPTGAYVPDGISTANARDSRVAQLTGISTQSMASSDVAPPGVVRYFQATTNANGIFYRIEFVLTPGFDFYVVSLNANQGMVATIRGRERPAFAGELTARA